MKQKNIFKAIIAVIVALVFVMPGSAVFANIGTIGVTSNSENTSDMENIVEISTNSDTSDNIETTSDSDVEKPVVDTEELSIVNDANSIVSATGKTWYVGSGPGNDSTTIQGGINLAGTGDTVYVYNGAYFENVLVNKTVDLIGESRENVIVDGSGSGEVVKVTANGVSIDTFTITNGSYGFRLYYVSNSNIMNCNICDNSGNAVYAFRLHGSPSTITNCNVYGNSGNALYAFRLDSSPSTITNCDVYNNSGSIVYGIYLDSSPSNITNCDVYNNGGGHCVRPLAWQFFKQQHHKLQYT